MAKYRKKPVVIDAVQWDGSDDAEDKIADLADRNIRIIGKKYIEIDIPEEVMTVQIGDWIIRSDAGEVYRCKPLIFAATYEEVK